MEKISIIPEPKKITVMEGFFKITPVAKIFISSEQSVYAVDLFRKKIKVQSSIDLELVKKGNKSKLYSMIIAGAFTGMSAEEGEKKREGYRLTVAQGRIELAASDLSGFFYGIQTLIQLLGNDSSIPCCSIEDWPSLEIRGIHVNLWAMMPRYDYLKNFIERLSSYKINTILLEYEDKFPYEKHPVIRHPLALSKEEIECLIKLAEAHCIEIIPLVQSFGHLVYVLKHKEYAHLAEDVDEKQNSQIGRDWQYCPLKPESLEMFKDMAGEVMEMHADSRFFHVGADETWRLGECTQCREFAEKHGKSRLFVDYMNKVGAFIKEKGRIPILWYDMLTNYPGETDGLSRDFRIMYWEYRMGSCSVPFIRWAARELSGREIIDQVPGHILKIFRKYWDCGEFPDLIKGFPYIRYLQDKGFKVLGAARYQGDWRMRVPNTMAFCEALYEEGAEGIVNTHWPGNAFYPLYYSGGEPLEVSWIPIMATAEAAWSPGMVSRPAFDSKFAKIFLGMDDDSLIRSLYRIGGIINQDTSPEVERRCFQSLEIFEEMKVESKGNRLFLDYMKWAAEVRAVQAKRVRIEKKVEASIFSHIERKEFSRWTASDTPLWFGFLSPGNLPEGLGRAGIGISELDDIIEELAALLGEIEAVKEESRNILQMTIRKEDVESLLSSSFVGKAGEYLGQLQMVRTCLKVEEYFKENGKI
jgi:hypothetical protein